MLIDNIYYKNTFHLIGIHKEVHDLRRKFTSSLLLFYIVLSSLLLATQGNEWKILAAEDDESWHFIALGDSRNWEENSTNVNRKSILEYIRKRN